MPTGPSKPLRENDPEFNMSYSVLKCQPRFVCTINRGSPVANIRGSLYLILERRFLYTLQHIAIKASGQLTGFGLRLSCGIPATILSQAAEVQSPQMPVAKKEEHSRLCAN